MRLQARGSEISVVGEGPGQDRARHLISGLTDLMTTGYPLKTSDVATAIRVVKEDPAVSLIEFFTESPFGPSLNSVVSVRNIKQRIYVQTIDRHDLVFAVGPAGTGKTYLAVAMTPRTDIVWIDVAASLTVLFDLFVESKYSRIPVVRGSVDTVVGIVHVKDFFQAIRSGVQRSISDLMREAYFVPDTKKVSELLREFQRRHLWMAIVVDEYGGVSGIVTVEDLLEEIVGEISDEHEDEREPVTRSSEQSYSVSGKANIAVIRDLFGRGPEEEEFTTVGGFLSSRLGHIPKPGEVLREFELRFTVEEADRRRVYRVKVEPDTSSQLTAHSPQPEKISGSRELKAES